MTYRHVPLGMMVVIQPDVARATIVKALDDAEDDTEGAAETLGVTRRTLYRWMAKLSIPLAHRPGRRA